MSSLEHTHTYISNCWCFNSNFWKINSMIFSFCFCIVVHIYQHGRYKYASNSHNKLRKKAFGIFNKVFVTISWSDGWGKKKCQIILQSKIDRALKMLWNVSSKNMTFTFMPYFTRWIIQFSMHNTSAGFVLLLLDFLHIQYIPSGTDRHVTPKGQCW